MSMLRINKGEKKKVERLNRRVSWYTMGKYLWVVLAAGANGLGIIISDGASNVS